jgi:hypothetical protein
MQGGTAMNNFSDQVARIVQTLVGLEGSSDISIISKRYPRCGPAEANCGYEEQTSKFSVASIPNDLLVPKDTDELVIRVDGLLPDPQRAGELKQQVNDFVVESEIGSHWDVRAKFKDAETSRAYQFTVFTNMIPSGDRVDLM